MRLGSRTDASSLGFVFLCGTCGAFRFPDAGGHEPRVRHPLRELRPGQLFARERPLPQEAVRVVRQLGVGPPKRAKQGAGPRLEVGGPQRQHPAQWRLVVRLLQWAEHRLLLLPREDV